MGDWPRLVNLRRCARGYIADSGEANNTTLALTNNSAAAELLLVWQVLPGANFGSPAQVSYQQRIAGLSPAGNMEAIVPGDALPPGILQSGDQPTNFPGVTWDPAAQLYWPATFPFAVLLPGWSLVLQSAATAPTSGLDVNIFWEAILSEYFDRMHSALCVELELRADSKS